MEKQIEAAVTEENDWLLSKILDEGRLARSEHEVELAKDMLVEFVQHLTKDQIVVVTNVEMAINARITALDKFLSAQLNEIIHHEEFQRLEASWRGLHHLIANAAGSSTLKIRVLNASKKDLLRDLEKASEFDQSELFKKIYEEEFGTFGGAPLSALIGDYEFSNHPQDLGLLEKIAQVGSAAHAPFIFAASPRLFGWDSFTEIEKVKSLTSIFNRADYAKWRSMRESEESRYLGLTFPRILMRAPYGPGTRTAETFNFVEETATINPLDGSAQNDHRKYLWGNAVYSFGVKLTAVFSRYSWYTQAPVTEGDDCLFPCISNYSKVSGGEEQMLKPCETAISLGLSEELSKLGFMPLVEDTNTGRVTFHNPTSCHKETVPLRLTMAASRIAHYLNSIMREKSSSIRDQEQLKEHLAGWISKHVLSGDEDQQAALRPIKQAEIEIRSIESILGSTYVAIVSLWSDDLPRSRKIELSLTLPSNLQERFLLSTTAHHHQYIEIDPAVKLRFPAVNATELTPAEARAILVRLRSSDEAHHGVIITDEAIDAAVELLIKHLPGQPLLGKARDLIDQAAVNKRFIALPPEKVVPSRRQQITREDVVRVLAEWTNIPAEHLIADYQQKWLEIENVLRRRVMGQDHAVSAVARVVRKALAGLSSPKRPHGVFLFTGPAGVGKTELARALAEFLFGSERRLLCFDMSKYSEEDSVSELIGAPPGHPGPNGGALLTDAVIRTPYCVLLFNDFEKAHPKVSELFLQLLDEGRLTDSRGRTADFRNTVIILRSNLVGGGKEHSSRLSSHVEAEESGKPTHPDEQTERPLGEEFEKALLTHFRPELVDSIDRVIEFHSLSASVVHEIIDGIITRIRERIADKCVELRLLPPAYDALIKAGYSHERGAREIEQIIEEQVTEPLAEFVLGGRIQPGGVVYVIPDAGGVSLCVNAPYPEVRDELLSSDTVLYSVLQPEARAEAAMLFIDIVRLTETVQREGDTAFTGRISRLHNTIRTHPLSAEMRFIKCVGGSFMAVYDSVATAVEVARSLLSSETDRSSKLRIVVHWGEIKVGADGDLFGTEVHRLFRVEPAKDSGREIATRGSALPEHSRIVCTRHALDRLREVARAESERGEVFSTEGPDETEVEGAEKLVGTQTELGTGRSVIDIDALLCPISGDNPAGKNLRYTDLYDKIREARRSDDFLEMGEWKREAKTADWNQVQKLAIEALSSATKDLLICAWLCEALVKLHGLAGLRDGLRLIRGMLEGFWDTMYPEMDEDWYDLEARANTLAWMERQLALAIRIATVDAPVSGLQRFSIS